MKIKILVFFLSIALTGFAQDEMKLIEPVDSSAPMTEAQALAQAKSEFFKNWGISMLGVDSLIFSGLTGNKVNVCICDTGLSQHSKIKENTRYAKNFSSDSTEVDLHGHSTHVGGIVVEIARLVNIDWGKGLNNRGGGSFFDVGLAIEWCVDNGAHIINLSLSGGRSAAVENAIKRAHAKGILIIAAAGNSGESVDGSDIIAFPARMDGVIAVGSLNRYMKRSSFSSTGKSGHVMAPGQDILAHGLPNKNNEDTYRSMSGTSMAAPYITGVAALYIELNGSSEGFKELLDSTAVDMGEIGFDDYTFYGHLGTSRLFSGSKDTVITPTPPPAKDPDEDIVKETSPWSWVAGVAVLFFGAVLYLLNKS